MRFANPLFLQLLWLLPVLILLFITLGKNREKRQALIGEKKLITRISDTVSYRKRRFYGYAMSFIVLLLVIVLARPQIGARMEEVKQKGVDVVVVVDTSSSMLADDLKPSRIEQAKREVSDFIDSLKGHRIGLVAFAGSGFVLSPLTMDYSALKIYLDILDTDLIPYQGTAIGNALIKAKSLFDPKRLKEKIIVLITDGEDHEGKLLDVCKELKKEGITLFSIGIGTTKGVPIHEYDRQGNRTGLKKDKKGGVIMSKLNPEILAQASALTGGKYYTASPRGLELKKIREEINAMEGHDLQEKFLIHYEDRYQLFLFLALFLFIVLFLLGERKGLFLARWVRRKIPFFVILLGLTLSVSSSAEAFINVADKDVAEANALYEEGKYDEALLKCDALLEEHPDSYELLMNKANILYKLGKYDEALAEYEKCSGSEKNTLLASSLYNKGNTLFRMGKLEEARDYYASTLKLVPSDPDAKYNLEVTYKQLQQQQQQCENKDQEKKKKSEKKKKEQQQQQEEQKSKNRQQNSEQQKSEEQKQQEKEEQQQDQKQTEEEKKQQEKQKSEEQKEHQKKQEEKQKQEQKAEEDKQKQEQKSEEQQQQSGAAESAKPEKDEKQQQKELEALKLLDALKDDEKDMQREVLQRRIDVPDEKTVEKDW